MDVDELRVLLRRSGVPQDAYLLDLDPPSAHRNGAADQRYVLDHDGQRWCVYYAERGTRTEERRFATESEACDELLHRIRRDVPVAAGPAIQLWPRWVRYPLIALLAAFIAYRLLSLVTDPWTDGAAAGVRVALAVGVGAVVVAAIPLLGRWRRPRPDPAVPAGVPSTDENRDRAAGEDAIRRQAVLDDPVEQAYVEARALRVDLWRDGYAGWPERIDAAIGGATTNEGLSHLSQVLTDMREDPALSAVWGERFDGLRGDMTAILKPG